MTQSGYSGLLLRILYLYHFLIGHFVTKQVDISIQRSAIAIIYRLSSSSVLFVYCNKAIEAAIMLFFAQCLNVSHDSLT